MQLRDRVALVTGAAGAVGAAVARRFAQEGARLALADESAEALGRIRDDLEPAAALLDGLSIDLADDGAVRALVDRVLSRAGQIDILVNAMGTPGEPPWDVPGPA